MKKGKFLSVLSFLLAVVMIFTASTPVSAASKNTKAKTKTFAYTAGTSYQEGYEGDYAATLKMTNVLSKKTKKSYSTKLTDSGKKVTFKGKNCNVITCEGKTTITVQPNEGFSYAMFNNFLLYSDDSKPNAVKWKGKYFEFLEAIDQFSSTKLDEAPEGPCVMADGTKITISESGTYILYIQPYNCWGEEDVDYKLNPVFIIIK